MASSNNSYSEESVYFIEEPKPTLISAKEASKITEARRIAKINEKKAEERLIFQSHKTDVDELYSRINETI